MNAAAPLRAPAGARAWVADVGYVYDEAEIAGHVEAGRLVLIVSDDGLLRGVTASDRAPLSSLVRLDTDLVEVVARLDDLGDTVAGLNAAEAGDKAEVLVRLRALSDRVAALEAAT